MKKIASFLFAVVLALTAQAQNRARTFEVYQIETSTIDKETGKFDHTTVGAELKLTVQDSIVSIFGADDIDTVKFRVLINRYAVNENMDFMVVDEQTGDLRELQITQAEDNWTITIHTVGNIVHLRAKL